MDVPAAPAVERPITAYDPPSRLTSFVDGKKAAGSEFQIPVINPATEQQIALLVEDDVRSVERAVSAARGAFDEGSWPRIDLAERKRIIRGAVDHVRRHADELAYLDCLDTGIPLWDIRGRKIDRLLENFEFFLEVASSASGETFQQNASYLTFVTREPVGVAAILAPWNSPMSLASMQIAPCIAFGNTCVVKPSEHTPVSLFRLVELLHQGGIPAGVINLVNGRGPVTGAALVGSPGVDLVKFIGGTETGKQIMATAAAGLKAVGLELGGKSANIIFADADLDAALDGALLGIYSNNGQQCLAGSRILVQREIAESFIDRFVARARAIRVGDPLAPSTEMGPLAYEGHYQRVLAYVDVAKAGGASLLTGGGRPEGLDVGYYFSPTAVLAQDPDARICQEEVFGPFATFLVFDREEQAIAIANRSRYGLVSYIWSNDVGRVMRVSQGVRAGTVWVNTPLMREVRAPFGGFKESGIGRDSGRHSLDFFTEEKTTTIPIQPLKLRRLGAEPL